MLSKSLLQVIMRDKRMDLEDIREEKSYHQRKYQELTVEEVQTMADIADLEKHIAEIEREDD